MVFGATRLDDDTNEEQNLKLTYAVKYVAKNGSQAADRIPRLRNEFEAYIKIEENRAKELGGESIPSCFGMFETDRSLALLIEYAGRPITHFDDIPLEERCVFPKLLFVAQPRGRTDIKLSRSSIYDAVRFLHAIGINHNDISPWNITRGDNSKYNLIDFTESNTKHKCPAFSTKVRYSGRYL